MRRLMRSSPFQSISTESKQWQSTGTQRSPSMRYYCPFSRKDRRSSGLTKLMQAGAWLRICTGADSEQRWSNERPNVQPRKRFVKSKLRLRRKRSGSVRSGGRRRRRGSRLDSTPSIWQTRARLPLVRKGPDRGTQNDENDTNHERLRLLPHHAMHWIYIQDISYIQDSTGSIMNVVIVKLPRCAYLHLMPLWQFTKLLSLSLKVQPLPPMPYPNGPSSVLPRQAFGSTHDKISRVLFDMGFRLVHFHSTSSIRLALAFSIDWFFDTFAFLLQSPIEHFGVGQQLQSSSVGSRSRNQRCQCSI